VDIVGIVKIKSKQYITIYDLSKITDPATKKLLLSFAHEWWWQSNRTIPVCLFFQEEMEKFEPYTQRFDTPSVNFVCGPVVSLSNLPQKRIKRRNVALKKK
jgi:hypothetical protein